MDSRYHIEITRHALGHAFDQTDLRTIIRANLGQDRLANLVGHPEIHFDDSAFAAGERYIAEKRRQAVEAAVDLDDRGAVLTCFGQLLHGRQDFYAHSNWVQLWVARHGGLGQCAPEEVDICPDSRGVPGLISGKGSVHQFLLCRIPVLGEVYSRRWLPPDSHEAMNLDHPGRGPFFPYAMAAATKHTVHELELLLRAIDSAGGRAAVDRLLRAIWTSNRNA